MARVRRPYWLPYSAVNWGICNLILAMMFELGMAAEEFAWARRFPLTLTLLAAHAALAVYYFLGRAAVVGVDGAARWRQARLPEPGEPPPGNRLAWPAPDALTPRVATPAARALTQKRRPVPRDLGEAPKALVLLPVLGFLGAVFVSIVAGVAGQVFNMPHGESVVVVVWVLWVAVLWVCLTAAIALKTRRLNEDA